MYSCCKTISNITSNSGHSFGVVMYFWIASRNYKKWLIYLSMRKKGGLCWYFKRGIWGSIFLNWSFIQNSCWKWWHFDAPDSSFGWDRELRPILKTLLGWSGDFKGSGFDEGFPPEGTRWTPTSSKNGVITHYNPQKMTLFFMDFSWGEISPYFLEIISPHLFHWFYKGPPVDMVGLVHPPNSRFRQRWYLRIFSSPKTVPWKFHGNFSSHMISGCQRNQQKRFRNTLRIIGSQN